MHLLFKRTVIAGIAPMTAPIMIVPTVLESVQIHPSFIVSIEDGVKTNKIRLVYPS